MLRSIFLSPHKGNPVLLPRDCSPEIIRVLFVCLGNICRSPMAEGVFRHKVLQAGLETRITTDSAGTGHWHVGELPHTETRRILTANHISYTHRARVFQRSDLDTFDYILTMDDANFLDVRSFGAGKAKVARLMDFAPQAGVREVPDPYYQGSAAYAEVFRLVSAAADGLLVAIVREQGWTPIVEFP
jgi:protein-tyrosine phosphatase